MNIKEAVNVLKAHNRWRRGYEDDMPHGPSTIGEAIDTVVAELEKPAYTPADMEKFSVWAYNNGWYYGELTEAWYNSEQLDDTRHTIEEVIKLWEETK